MNKTYRIFCASCGGLLIGLATIPQAVVAETAIDKTVPKVNPCPSIFYEIPHYDQVLVPLGCEPNGFTRKMIDEGKLPVNMGIGGEGEMMQAPVAESPIRKPDSKVNPCPSIFYEKPHGDQVFVPLGCPLNNFTRQMFE